MRAIDPAGRHRDHRSTGGKVSITKTNTPPWTFAANCAASAGLCAVNQYADASPTITPAVHDDGMLCGR